MKIVAILASPHGAKGATGQLLEALVSGAREAGAEVRTFSIGEKPLAPCRACDVCHRTGECPIRDDFGMVRDAMLDADGVVLASPNYIFSVSAQMKALLDRCCGPLHRVALTGKHAAAVVTSGGSGSQEVEAYLLRFLRAMGAWTAGSVAAEARQMFSPDDKAQRLDEAAALGRRLVEAIHLRTEYPEQATEQRAFRERMKALVEMRKAEWRFEHEYWKSIGEG